MSTIIVRQGSTGTYHRGFANSPGITLCNHSGQRRRMWTRPAKPAEIERAAEHSFCRKCFSPEAVRQAKEAMSHSAKPLNHPLKGACMTHDDYFIGTSGQRYRYADLATLVREKAPETLGKHIFVQLAALGLLEEMEGGVTPCGLPFTFA